MTGEYKDGTKFEDIFDSVVFAVGRDAETAKINLKGNNQFQIYILAWPLLIYFYFMLFLSGIGVVLNEKNGKVLHDENEKTNVDNIYAIGDVLDGKPELTPVAIQVKLDLILDHIFFAICPE